MAMLELRTTDGGGELSVRVQARASHNAVHDLRGMQLRVAVAAPPSEVDVGPVSRDKTARVAGLSAAEATRHLASILPGVRSPATYKR